MGDETALCTCVWWVDAEDEVGEGSGDGSALALKLFTQESEGTTASCLLKKYH